MDFTKKIRNNTIKAGICFLFGLGFSVFINWGIANFYTYRVLNITPISGREFLIMLFILLNIVTFFIGWVFKWFHSWRTLDIYIDEMTQTEKEIIIARIQNSIKSVK